MKIELDTTNKTIKLPETVEAGKLFEVLETLLPNGKWSDFKLLTNEIIQWVNTPIYVPSIQPIPSNLYDYPWIVTAQDGVEGTYHIKYGTFEIEVGE